MATNPEIAAIDAAIQLQLDLLRHSNSIEYEVLKVIERMRRELIAKLAQDDLTDFSRARLNALLKDSGEVVKGYYAQIQALVDPSLAAVADIAARSALAATVTLDGVMPSAKAMEALARTMLVEGAPSAQWWSRQALDTTFRFAAEVRQGIAQGETISQIYKRVGEATDLAGRNSRALVHTSVMQAASDARMATIDANQDIYVGYRQLSTLDGHTTPVCMARAGMEWDINKKPIGNALPFRQTPLHWGCRSIIMGILKPMAEFGLKEPTGGTRSSAEGQIARDTSFTAFLERRTIAQQNEQLGEGRAQLWRDGKITLRQLVDNRGNPLTLAQLKQKYDK